MMFLIRVAFWLTIVLILLPSGESSAPPQASQVGAVEAFTAASAAVSDVGGFCSRQPEACTVGAQAATALGHKAQAGAKMVYEYLTDKASGQPGKPAVATVDKSTQSTLTDADRSPPWRGPQARPEYQSKRQS
jgi:hypothetical protein